MTTKEKITQSKLDAEDEEIVMLGSIETDINIPNIEDFKKWIDEKENQEPRFKLKTRRIGKVNGKNIYLKERMNPTG